ncbi:MAG: DUF4982 domain-containing protein [Clostridia bacterium]|nr:DUF4982 domain-containing protein [Clostridia bacterium]
MRKTEVLKYGYRFKKFEADADVSAYLLPAFDDSGWDEVRVPHDWAIGEEFRAEYDANESTIKADGIEKPILLTGRTGALPSMGTGVYRRWLDLSDFTSEDRLFLELDGVMYESVVYLNGKYVGGCHYGYKSYCVELTDSVNSGGNLLAIVATVRRDCSRWYTGGGIFRHVRLVKKPYGHIRYNGVWVRQLSASSEEARLYARIDREGEGEVALTVISPEGETAFEGKTAEAGMHIRLEAPALWDIDSPYLYTLKAVYGEDEAEVRFGLRRSEFTPDGYFLNGRKLKLHGVCMHHDLGSLGSAVNKAAIKRQLTILRDMGVNAVRTSHNPPAPELLDLCDELGFLVLDEFLDEWYTGKVRNGYAKYYHDHAIGDIADIVRRDRNHPSVIMWSTGNEMLEQWQEDGWKPTKALAEATRLSDPTRPVTCGFSAIHDAERNNMYHYADVVGINYQPYVYEEYHKRYPDMPLFGSETASCVSTRGVYRLPPEVEIPAKAYDDLTVSAYELCAPGWAYYAERELWYQRKCDFVAGEFVWTGFDYLGEPTPYYGGWPARSSQFGAVDLAGLPKNRYYCYKAAWGDEGVLHIFPHWNWREAERVPVHVYTNYPCTELFINGKSQGKRYLEPEDELHAFRMTWDDITFEAGELTAVGYDADGKEATRRTVKSAGEPHSIRLTADREVISADGDDLVYITAAIVDKEGNLCPRADDRLIFSVTGAGELLTTDAGDHRETEPFTRHDKKALSGMLVACVRSIREAGTITVACKGEGLLSHSIDIITE